VTYVNKTVGTKVTSNEYEKITQLVEAGIYLSNSDFAREAIRDKLRSIEIIKIPQQAYEDEVADDLELDLKLVMQITEELAKEGRLGEV
jgi:Arc/MetJ-type ribon-helix-helix transcriptional regulator